MNDGGAVGLAAGVNDRTRLHQLIKSGIIHHKDDGISDGIKAANDGIGIKVSGDEINPVDDGINDGTKGEISVAVRKHPGIRVPALALLVGRSKPTVERAVAQLKKEGRIEYRGSKKTGGYYLI